MARRAQLLSEVLLAVLLMVALAFSWRDGVPSDGYVAAVVGGPIQSDIALAQVSESRLDPGTVTEPLEMTVGPPPSAPVPTARPVQLLIPSLYVNREVEAVGVDRRGVLNMPLNAWNAGWYRGGPVPGAPGDTVIEGHAGSPEQPMLFGKLVTLRRGERIVVVTSDGLRRLFLVATMASVPIGAVPPGMAQPYGPPRLTLITCTGYYDKDKYTWSQRLAVDASYAGLV